MSATNDLRRSGLEFIRLETNTERVVRPDTELGRALWCYEDDAADLLDALALHSERLSTATSCATIVSLGQRGRTWSRAFEVSRSGPASLLLTLPSCFKTSGKVANRHTSPLRRYYRGWLRRAHHIQTTPIISMTPNRMRTGGLKPSSTKATVTINTSGRASTVH